MSIYKILNMIYTRPGKSIYLTALSAGVLFFMASAAQANPKSVVLSDFHAMVVSDTSALILWTTESEQNSYQWRLERGVDSAGPYYLRATLPAAGNSTMPTDYQYLDHPLSPDTLYFYRLAEIDLGGVTTYFGPITVCTGVEGRPNSDIRSPIKLELQAAPNPFGQYVNIKYRIPKDGLVDLQIFNMAGQKVRTLVNGRQAAGFYKVAWNSSDDRGRKMTNGVYFYKLTSGGFKATKKIILLVE